MAAKSLGAFGLLFLLLLSSVCGSAKKETCMCVCVGGCACVSILQTVRGALGWISGTLLLFACCGEDKIPEPAVGL